MAVFLQSAGNLDQFEANRDDFSKDAAIDWLLQDPANSASVQSSIEAGPTCAHGPIREATTAAYLSARDALSRKAGERDLLRVLSALHQRTALVRGMTHGTMLRNEISDFARLGTFIERVDSTARILEVKFHVLLPSVSAFGTSLDIARLPLLIGS